MRFEPALNSISPESALAAWPRSTPLAALFSGDTPSAHARWVILARPRETVIPATASECLSSPAFARPASPHDRPPPQPTDTAVAAADLPPFRGGWIITLGYELGAALEPRAIHNPGGPRPRSADFPLAIIQRCDDALAFDRRAGRWWSIGATGDLVDAVVSSRGQLASETFTLGRLASTWGKRGYTGAVRRALEYIRAGDAYQINLAHHLDAPFRGSARTLLVRLLDASRPWYGAYMEAKHLGRDLAVCSASPELFLMYDPESGRIFTRPMKGTRAAEEEPAELMGAVKDSAELNMIVDLMRNDLGRVCRLGSIRVDEPREIERHGSGLPASVSESSAAVPAGRGVLQATATISGSLRDDRTFGQVLEAVFPGGSVTGAPKLRAMQIINELEPRGRGPYCGAIGFVSDSGHAAFNIAIRTAVIRADSSSTTPPLGSFESGVLSYPVGAGIVADSDPDAEWQETLLKARTITCVAPLDGQ